MDGVHAQLCCGSPARFFPSPPQHQVPLPLVRRWSEQIFRAIAYIHSQLIIHPDLKPDNILLVLDGDSAQLRAVLGDFGSTRECNEGPSRPMTRAICTSWYRAPELSLPRVKCGVETDMWSSCVLGELLLGMPIFQSMEDTAEEHIKTIIHRVGGPCGNDKRVFQKLCKGNAERRVMGGPPFVHAAVARHSRRCQGGGVFAFAVEVGPTDC